MDESSGSDPGAPISDTNSIALENVQWLLDDVRTLLGYVARRGRTGAGNAGAAAMPINPAIAQLSADSRLPPPPLVALIKNGLIDLNLLAMSPAEIAADGSRVEKLYATVTWLTDLAAPATIMSIRLTSALLGSRRDGPLRPEAALLARRLIRWLSISGVLGLGVFIAVIMLLVHVDRGRRAVHQLQQLRGDYQAALIQAASTREPLEIGDLGLARCPTLEERPSETPDPPARLQYREACGRLDGILVRTRIAQRELAQWNTTSDVLRNLSPLSWTDPQSTGRSPGLSAEEWESSELRTAVMMGGLTGFILPMLLGLLGACAYVYRTFDGAVLACTLKGSEGVDGVLRMLLGAMLGGLLGLIWTNGQAIQLDGATLSLGAVGFAVGFSVEIVFQMLETIVVGVARRLGKTT